MKRKKVTLVVCAILIAAGSFAQDIKPYLLKESMRIRAAQLKSGIVGSYPRHTEEFNWDEDWVLYQTIETSYTTFGEPQAIEYTQGTNKNRDLFSYDGHNLIERKSQQWTGGAWVDFERWTSSYNALGYETESRNEQWNGSSWVMKGGTQTTITMDGNRIQVVTDKDWNPDTGTWVNSGRQTYSYSGAGQYFASVILENWENQWVPSMKMDYTWSGDHFTEVIVFEYDNSAWKRSMKYTYEYPDALTTKMTMYMDDEEGGWTGATRTTTTLDTHGNLTLEQMEMFIMDWTVFMSTRFQLTYDGNNLTQRITQTYSMFPPTVPGTNTTPLWKNVFKEVFSNFASLSTDITLIPDTGLTIFPNPAGKEAVVRLSLPKAGTVILSVFTMTGQKVLEEIMTSNGSDVNYQMNLSTVSPGSYLVIARDKQGNEIGKARLIKDVK